MLCPQVIGCKIIGITKFEFIGDAKLDHGQQSIVETVSHAQPEPLDDQRVQIYIKLHRSIGCVSNQNIGFEREFLRNMKQITSDQTTVQILTGIREFDIADFGLAEIVEFDSGKVAFAVDHHPEIKCRCPNGAGILATDYVPFIAVIDVVSVELMVLGCCAQAKTQTAAIGNSQPVCVQ